MRGLPSTLILVCVSAALVGYIYYVRQSPPPVEERERVFAVEATDIEELTVTTSGETAVLRKANDAWRLVSPVDADADESEMKTMTERLAELEMINVVDENVSDFAQYGLAEPQVVLEFKTSGTSGRLSLGDTTPTSTGLYARRDDDARVILVADYFVRTFGRTAFQLRDKRVLRIARADVETVEIAGSGRTMQLTRSGSEWSLTQPYTARGDYSIVESLVTQLSTAPMASIVTEHAEGLGPYGLDRPALTVRLGAGSTSAVLQVGREEDGRVFARDASRPLVFTIEKTLADDLARPAEAYRPKDLFAFRLYNTERVIVTRGADRAEFERRPGEEGGPADTWHRVDGPEAPTTAIQDALTTLVNLRAEAFIGTAEATGLNAPELVVEATFDQGRTERVSFGRSASNVFAARSGEPGAARMDAAAFAGALEALAAAMAPTGPVPSTSQ